MSSERACAAIAAMRAGLAELLACDTGAWTDGETLDLAEQWERFTRQLPSQTNQLTARIATIAPRELGSTTIRGALSNRLAISRSEAGRRLADAEQLAARHGLTGIPLEPLLAITAAAIANGAIGPEHVRIIRSTMDKLPSSTDLSTRTQAEADLVSAATGLTPDAFKKVAERLLTLLDPDGPMPDDADRARKRGIWIGPQGADGMSPIKGNLDPQARATWEAILAKWAAPGMCNPDDHTPCTSGTPSTAQIDGDDRNIGQRNHDALTALGRSMLSSADLGQHNGLPVTIIVSTTLQELESAAGCALTAGGTLLPMADVIRMAGHAHHYLRIYDRHTRQELFLGRTKRLASQAQRIVLYARDRGCTAPGCHVPGYGTQVHHVQAWTKDNGPTDITHEVLACKGHNLAAEHGWTVRIRDDGHVEWIPPPHLDTGQARTNIYHHPERHQWLADEPQKPPGDT